MGKLLSLRNYGKLNLYYGYLLSYPDNNSPKIDFSAPDWMGFNDQQLNF